MPAVLEDFLQALRAALSGSEDSQHEPALSETVKVIHASELNAWMRIPEYRDHDGPRLGEYRARRAAAEAALRELRDLARAQDRLAALDVATPVEYARHRIEAGGWFGLGGCEIVLPEPDHPSSTITCDTGQVVGRILRVPRSWRKRPVTARYACPSRVRNADEIARLRAAIVGAGDATRERLADAQTSRYRQPLLFISHRWEAIDHPDPDGHQLAKLKALKDCFLIYDYASFPQNVATSEDEQALLQVLSGMNSLISNVVVLTAPDFLQRGWCIYEYILASMRASIVCDELNADDFVTLRNVAATNPPVSPKLLGHSIESGIQNAKNETTLKTVNAILPLFRRSKFTVERDRDIVTDLLVAELMRMLPSRKEYIPYVGEWISKPWTEDELRGAFASELKWERLQATLPLRLFEPKVPSALAEAVKDGYRLDRMPPQNEWTWLTLVDTKPFAPVLSGLVQGVLLFGLIAAAAVVLLLVLLVLLAWWIFF